MAREAAEHPSGHQHNIRHGDQRAVITQVGASLREYEAQGFPVIDGFDASEMASSGRGQPLIPWPNRLAGGRYQHDGQRHQVPLSEPDLGNAIHGLVRWAGWDLLWSQAAGVGLGCLLWPQTGYPFTLALELAYELSDAGLRVTLTAENAGRTPAPFGAGQHPYVRAQLEPVDTSVLRLPADRWLELDAHQVPTGRVHDVEGGEYDFRQPRPVGALRLDTAFTHLERDPEGVARVTLSSPAQGRTVTVWVDAGFDHLMIFSGDPLEPARQRRSLAVEPMTCAPNAFNNGLGLRVLAPGERFTASWGIGVSSGAE